MTLRGTYLVKCTNSNLTNGTIVVSDELSNIVMSWARGSSVRAKPDSVYGTPTSSAPLNVGDVTQPVANTGPLLATSIAEGDNFVDVTGSAPTPGEWYFLIDFNRLERQANSSTYRPIGGELLQVNTVEQIDASTWNVVFYQNVGRGYAAGSRLSTSPNGKVLQNIGIRGLRVTGIRDKSNAKGTIAALNIRYVVGLSLQNCRVNNSWSTGTAIHYCRDVEITGHYACEMGKAASTGTGYSLQVQQCRSVSLERISARDARYACQFEAGCTVFNASGISGIELISAAVFDIHGGDSYKGTISLVMNKSDQAVQIGNSSWRLGATSVAISHSSISKLVLQGQVKDCDFNSSRIDHIEFYSYEDTSPTTAYFPENNRFNECTISCLADTNAITFNTGGSSFYQVPALSFDYCELTANPGNYVMDVPIMDGASDITFDHCTISAATGVSVMRIGGNLATVYASDTTFKLSTGGSVYIAVPGGSQTGTFFNKTNGGTTNNTRDPNPSAPPPTRSLISSDVSCNWDAD
jgi:hypothetical protein